MTPEIEDKIRRLGLLAQAQMAVFATLDPENTAQIRQFEENSARATTLIGELAVALDLDSGDAYAFFCRITSLAAEHGSDAGDALALCLPQMAALRG